MSQYPSGQDPFGGKPDPFGQQPTHQSPYQSPQGGQGYQPPLQQGPPLSPLALTSGICGMAAIFVSFFSCCCGLLIPVSFIGSLVAVITGHMALAKFQREPGRESGREFGLIGLICGYIGLAFAVLMFILLILSFVAPAMIPFFAPNQKSPFEFPPIEIPEPN